MPNLIVLSGEQDAARALSTTTAQSGVVKVGNGVCLGAPPQNKNSLDGVIAQSNHNSVIANNGAVQMVNGCGEATLKTSEFNAGNAVVENGSSDGGVLRLVGCGSSSLDISSAGSTQQQPNSVLRIIIDNMLYPVTLDILHAIFTRFGKVLRIITFSKNNTFQALIQLSEANAAQNAKNSLDGLSVYSGGCCILRIDYSKLATLNVKYNNDKSRDFTNPNLPCGELTYEQRLSLAFAAAAAQGVQRSIVSGVAATPASCAAGTPSAVNPLAGSPATFMFPTAAAVFPLGLNSSLAKPTMVTTSSTGHQHHPTVQNNNINVSGAPLFQHPQLTSINNTNGICASANGPVSAGSAASANILLANNLVTMSNANNIGGVHVVASQPGTIHSAALAQPGLATNSCTGIGPAGGPTTICPSAFSTQQAIAAASAASNAAALLNLTAASIPTHLGALFLTPVVLVSNLNDKTVTCEALFTLFGVYGDVQRVKILFNKKDNALVQYSEPQQAQIAIQHLDKVRWDGKQMRVTASKHQNVQMPKEGQPDSGLTKDFSNSPLHRFKKPGSKNYLNIYPPSSTLHLSNIPPNTTEQFMLDAFAENRFKIAEFKFFQRDHKMALLQLEDIETAVNALVKMHNYKLAENAHLRVSFSKKELKSPL